MIYNPAGILFVLLWFFGFMGILCLVVVAVLLVTLQPWRRRVIIPVRQLPDWWPAATGEEIPIESIAVVEEITTESIR